MSHGLPLKVECYAGCMTEQGLLRFAIGKAARIISCRSGQSASFSEHSLVPLLEPALHPPHKLVRHGAVDDAMVERQRQVDHGPDRDGVVADHRALLDGAHAENRYLRLIDDRGSEQAADG